MRWGISALFVMLSVAVLSSAVHGQGAGAPNPTNPFGAAGGGGQPPAPPPTNPFGGVNAPAAAAKPAVAPAAAKGAEAPAAGATSADLAGDQKLVDEMVGKKVLFKAIVKGKLASIWVGAAFAELPSEQQTNVARAAYKVWVTSVDSKFKGPVSLLLSDGQKAGGRLGTYVVTTKGDSVKLLRTAQPQQQAGFDPSFFPPVQPVQPPDDGGCPFGGCN